MVGGCPNTFERALPLFQAMGKNITRVGGNGDGQTAKVANQIIVALNIRRSPRPCCSPPATAPIRPRCARR